MNKYTYLYVIQGNYLHGWEDVDATENHKEASASIKTYRKNEPKYLHRLIRRRELNQQECGQP